jgi:hypothetical protein
MRWLAGDPAIRPPDRERVAALRHVDDDPRDRIRDSGRVRPPMLLAGVAVEAVDIGGSRVGWMADPQDEALDLRHPHGACRCHEVLPAPGPTPRRRAFQAPHRCPRVAIGQVEVSRAGHQAAALMSLLASREKRTFQRPLHSYRTECDAGPPGTLIPAQVSRIASGARAR